MHKDRKQAAIYVALLKSCAKQKNIQRGSRLHSDIVKSGLLENNVYIGNSLVDMYVKCGDLNKAQEAFDQLILRTTVSWAVLIAGYSQTGKGEKALHYLHQMQCEAFPPNDVVIACILKACGSIGAAEKGQEIHALISTSGLLKENIIVGNALLDMYSKCGLLGRAKDVFDELSVPDVVSWTAMIAGYAQHGHNEEAFNLFQDMQAKGISPNVVTFACILKVCGSLCATEKGQELHSTIVREGLLETNDVVGSAIVDMYARSGLLQKAQETFDTLPVRNVLSWNTLIAGYAQNGDSEDALSCYDQMQSSAVIPNAATFICTLKACASLRAFEKGQEIHNRVVEEGLLEKHIMLGTAVVDMYGKCGKFAKAQEVFDKLTEWDVVSWSVLITSYAQFEHDEEALSYFDKMQCQGFLPNAVTIICALKSCGNIGAAYKGQMIHAEIIRYGFLEGNITVGNTLVDMYANCGMLFEAQKVFDELSDRDIVSWTALILGYAHLGKSERVFNSFNRMLKEGNEPDNVMFTILLNTCNHSGLPDMGHICFQIMNMVYGIIPTLEHYKCMIDLFGRVGQLDEAVILISRMPYCTTSTMWHIVLSACQRLESVNVGREAFKHLQQLNENDVAAYIYMSNIYATTACG